MTKTAAASGKMILSGDYAVVFGFPGIAVPARTNVEVTWKDSGADPMEIVLEGLAGEERYARRIVDECISKGGTATGTLVIRNWIPVGRGMGSSTALVIGICRCLLGDDHRVQSVLIEDMVNPGNSGLDFAVIWENKPVLFKKGSLPEPADIPLEFLAQSVLIDTGKPNETTAELVAWIRSREDEVWEDLEAIGRCTEHLLRGDDPGKVIKAHHRLQVRLGVVPEAIQELIIDIEDAGGSAKVLGAGARTGGGGMVLAFSEDIEGIRRIGSAFGKKNAIL